MTIDNLEIEIVTVYKYLGFMLDNKFSFGDHVCNQLKKLTNVCIVLDI